MNIEVFREYCLAKNAVTESFPFDETTLVFKVMGKLFALTDTSDMFSLNLKCEPEKAVELREFFPSVTPGYHMNKKHWITVIVDGSIPDKILLEWVDNSYNLVIGKLPKSIREQINS